MYKQVKKQRGSLFVTNHYEGERIEQKVERFMVNKAPITDKAPVIYTDRGEGVIGETDIRHDKWETAAEGMDQVAGAHIEKRDKPKGTKIQKDAEGKDAKNPGEKRAGGESTHATDGPGNK